MWTLANHHSQLLEGLDFQVCYSASAQTRKDYMVPFFANRLG